MSIHQYKMLRAFTPEAEAACKLPQGMLFFCDSATGKHQRMLIESWKVVHDAQGIRLSIEVIPAQTLEPEECRCRPGYSHDISHIGEEREA